MRNKSRPPKRPTL